MDSLNIFGYAAIGFSACFYFSLALPFFKVLQCKLNYEYTPIIFIDAIYVDSLIWYIFADKIFCDQLKLSSIIGCCCSLFLIAIYLGFELKKYLIDSVLNCLILILGTLVIYRGLNFVIEDDQLIGKIAVGTKIITFCSLFYMIYKVIKEKNYKLISPIINITYMAACIGWLLFGKFANEKNIMIANGIGIALCCIQLIVYFNFKKRFPGYSGSSSTIEIERSSSEDTKKDESTTMSIGEESQDKGKEKPVKIINRVIEN